MTTYNVATEQAEKLAVRLNSKGGASPWEGEAGAYLLAPPFSVTPSQSTTGGSLPATTTYYYYVTRVSNGVESFSSPVQSITTGTGTASNSVTFAIVDQPSVETRPVTASSFNLYVGTTAANATKQATTGTTTLSWTVYTTSGTAYSSSPAVVAYPESLGQFTPYQSASWATDAIVHNPNAVNGYSGVPTYGLQTQVRQIRTNIAESQIYSRTDTATLTILSTTGNISYSNGVITVAATSVTSTNLPVGSVVTISGSSTAAFNGTWTVASFTAGTGFTIVTQGLTGTTTDSTIGRTVAVGFILDSSISWFDFGKPVTLAAGLSGIPTNAFVGQVTAGVGFQLSSVQGQSVPYWPATNGTTSPLGFVVTSSTPTQITVTGSNVGPIPVQLGQYKTARWQG